MKRFLFLALFLLALSSVVNGQAQHLTEQSIARLQSEIARREAVDRDESTPADLKAMNRSILDREKTELLNSIQARISGLQKYLEALGNSVTPEERSFAQKSLRNLSAVAEEAGSASARSASADVPASGPPLRRIPVTNLAASFLKNEGRSEADIAAPAPIAPPAPLPQGESHRFMKDPSCGDTTVTILGAANAPYRLAVTGGPAVVMTSDGNGQVVFSPVGPLKANDVVGVSSHLPVTPASEVRIRRSVKCGGQLVGYLLGGVVLSQQAEEFSQSDPFFGFIAGYDSKVRKAKSSWLDSQWHLRFQGVFTADGRSATGQAAPVAPNDTTPDKFTFVASRKAFTLDTHGWVDLWARNTFSMGPYAAWGLSTVLSKNELANQPVTAGSDAGQTQTPQISTQTTSDNDAKGFQEAGIIINMKPSAKSLFLQAIMAYGRYEGFKGLDDNVDNKAVWRVNNTSNRFIGKLRIFPAFLDTRFGEQVAGAPMFGVEVNAGTGPDHIKFFTGYAIRIGKIDTTTAAEGAP
jgi:hypothetical protein